jgi:hypothetical protein
MSAEKELYNNTAAPAYDDHQTQRRESKVDRIAEAAELYGDIATAEEYGYVTRG